MPRTVRGRGARRRRVRAYLAYLYFREDKHKILRERCLVAARTPLEAARCYANRLAAVKMLPRGNRLRVYVCEYVWDGRLGFKIAADSNGDKRYDVVYDGKSPPTVVYSEKSYA